MTNYIRNAVFAAFAAAASLLLLTPTSASAATIVEPGFEAETVVAGLTLPTNMAFAPDGRVFITEKGGSVRVVKNGVLLPAPVITLTDVNSFADRGLIGIALDPNFASNNYMYLSYTYENSPGANYSGPKTGRIVRITLTGDTASEASKFVLVGSIGGNAANPSCENFAVTSDCIPSDSGSHSVGGLKFGPDGKLYATLGDGADFNAVDPRALRAQNLDSLGGKMLRINTDGTAPSNNPFYNGNANANRSKVYIYGIRNSFRFNFAPDGRLFAGDVGWSTWEEINRVIPGANFGWPCWEGNATTPYACQATGVTLPTYTYQHNANGAGSITGGAFPGNGAYPAQYNTSLFIGDYAQNWVKRVVIDQNNNAVSVHDFIPNTVWPVDIAAGPDGNIYYIDVALGELVRITHTTGNRRPIVEISANPTSGLSPLQVAFSSAGSSDPDGNPLTYAWNFGDGQTSAQQNPTHTYAANGTYTASLTLTDSLGSAATKSITITVGNQAPTATITSPNNGSFYVAGQPFTVTGQGSDPENGALPASAMRWQLIMHHNTHIHQLQEFTGVPTISFTAEDHGDPSVYIEVILTVTDSAGLTNSRSINLYLNNGAAGGNLISNPSLEIEDSLPGQPQGWSKGGYGVNNWTYTYPVAGFDGAKAARVELTSWQSGDIKWVFSPVFVTPGQQYTYSNYYTANVPTSHVAQFGFPNGTSQYVYLGELPAAATPTKVTRTITIPAGVQTLSVFHNLERIGVLTIDNFSLTAASGGTPDATVPTAAITTPSDNATVSGTVTVTGTAADNVGVAGVTLLVDGIAVGAEDTTAPYSFTLDTTTLSNANHTLSIRARDAAGNLGVSPTITVAVNNTTGTQNLILNGDFETANGANPQGWTPVTWGGHTPLFTYPVTGRTGGKAIQVQITSYPVGGEGDSRYQHNDVPVTPGTEYTYEEWYKATTISDVIGRYTMQNGSYVYFGLIKEIPGAVNWTKNTATFIPPTGAVSVSLLHVIGTVATLTLDDVRLSVTGSGTPSETVPPVVNFTAPANNATVSGVVTLTATATDNVGVAGVFFAVDGTPVGAEITTAPYTYQWNSANVANGTHVLKATARDAVGNNAAVTITVTVNNAVGGDTTAPTAVVTAPAANATLSGNATVTGTAADNVGVAGVTLLVDGIAVGAEDTTAPYSFTLDTTTLTNGAHTIAIRARDAAGNLGTSATVAVTVSNSVPTGPNLISNPSLETGTTTPTGWSQGGWGTNNRVFNYPVAGTDGAKAARTEITTFTNGDAKWFFSDVAVTAGQLYTLTHSYRSNVATNLTIRYTLAGGAVQYAGIGNIAASTSWAVNTLSITPPANTVSMTLFHSLVSAGWLEVDKYSLTGGPASPSDAFSKGKVSFTFDDGWYSQYTDALPILNNASVKGSFYIITNDTLAAGSGGGTPAGPNLVQNPSMETAGTGGSPANWAQGAWGTNTRTFTYPVAGTDGAKAAKVEITAYTNGDAKWYFTDVPVTAGQQYVVSHSYNSTAPTQILARYTLTGGSVQYVSLATPASSAGSWQNFQQTITVPANVVSLTIFHTLAQVGSLTTDMFSVSTPGTGGGTQTTINASQVLALQSAGHEIGSHTKSHPDLTAISPAAMQEEITGSKQALTTMGVTTVNTLAYPLGAYNADVKTAAQSAGYVGARSVERGYNLKNSDKYALKIQQVDRTTTLAEMQTWVQQAANNNTWLILMFHQIDGNTGAELGTTPALLQQMVNYTKTANVDIVTMREGIALMN